MLARTQKVCLPVEILQQVLQLCGKKDSKQFTSKLDTIMKINQTREMHMNPIRIVYVLNKKCILKQKYRLEILIVTVMFNSLPLHG